MRAHTPIPKVCTYDPAPEEEDRIHPSIIHPSLITHLSSLPSVDQAMEEAMQMGLDADREAEEGLGSEAASIV